MAKHRGDMKKIPARNVVYILCNGVTENNLLELLRKQYKSIYKIKVKNIDTTPSGLVQYAINNLLKDPSVNQIWTLFDTEDESKLPSSDIELAYSLARENGIKMCYCNPQIELFLLSCLENVGSGIDVMALIPKINKHLKGKNPSIEYNKNDPQLLKTYFLPKFQDGLDRVKANYQTRVKESNINGDVTPMWKQINTTNIFELIESLKFAKRN